MLAIAFFTLIFSSLLWLIYAVGFVHQSLAGISFFDAGVANVMLYALLVCVPIFLLWAVFGYVNQYLNNKMVNTQLRKLMGQMKKNQDYSDLLARALIETEQHINDGFILSQFDLLIADMNELLSEIIRGCKLASTEQIDGLWSKVQNGGKWSFGKVIIEVNNSQPAFQKRVFERAIYDGVLGGTIMEFAARYQAVLQMLDKHDQDKLFLNMIETGVMGKVFSILSPVASELHRGRDAAAGFAPKKEAPAAIKVPLAPQPQRQAVYEEESPKESMFKKINLFKKKPEEAPTTQATTERDPFSVALERSFGSDEAEAPRLSISPNDELSEPEPMVMSAPSIEPDEPRFETKTPEIILPAAEMTDTEKTLDSLRKEWAEVKTSPREEPKLRAADELDEESLAYPFGSWTDEQNYRK